MGGIHAPSQPSASHSLQCSTPSDQMWSFRGGDKSWLTWASAAKESQDEVLKGDPAPRTLNPPLTQHFSTSGRGHKGFPTWITAPSPALDDSTKVLAEPGVGWGWGTQGTSTGQERDQLAPNMCWHHALTPSFSPMNLGEKTLQVDPYLPPPRRAELSPKCP